MNDRTCGSRSVLSVASHRGVGATAAATRPLETDVTCFQVLSARTVDQMVQAARSGKQNIVEGSKAATASKDMEIKLTNVARASAVRRYHN